MKKILFTLFAMSVLVGATAQNKKCGIDTKALVAEQIAAGATSIDMLAKVSVGFDRTNFEKAGIVFGAQAGQIVTMRVPVTALPLLDNTKEVIQYSISHKIAAPECNQVRFDTRTDSVHQGLGVTGSVPYDGEGVYIGVTDWGFDYSHPNYNAGSGNLRLEMAWDHFKLSGPSPAEQGYGEGLDYGTLTTTGLRAAKGDTANLYGYGTHGTHVAGICAGRGVDGDQMGQAPGAKLLFCSFGLGEKPWMDAVAWMKQVAQDSSRRLVINSSWGMYSFSTIDGSSLLSQAINAWSDEGIVFCTSGGNNGRTSIPFHISRTFRSDTVDTLKTVVVRASDIYSIHETGQVLVMWGEENHDFSTCIRLRKNDSTLWRTPMFSTAIGDTVIYDTIVHEGEQDTECWWNKVIPSTIAPIFKLTLTRRSCRPNCSSPLPKVPSTPGIWPIKTTMPVTKVAASPPVAATVLRLATRFTEWENLPAPPSASAWPPISQTVIASLRAFTTWVI